MRLGGWTWEETIHPRGNASFHQNGSLKGVADPPKFSGSPFLKKSIFVTSGAVLMLDPRSATHRSIKIDNLPGALSITMVADAFSRNFPCAPVLRSSMRLGVSVRPRSFEKPEGHYDLIAPGRR